jgi:RNA polymerase sigma-70 factor (ECF subfamily)
MSRLVESSKALMASTSDEDRSADDDLVPALRAREGRRERESLLADFFTRWRPRLYAMVELRLDRRVRRRLSPSDVIQDAFVEAAKMLPKYLRDPRLPIFLWVRLVIADTLYDIHRKHLRAKGRDVRREEATGHGSAGPEASSVVLAGKLAAQRLSPSEAAAASERRKALAEAIERLEASDREILALRAFEMLSNAEAALVLEIQPATARQRYWRALRRLKALLAGRGQGEEAD